MTRPRRRRETRRGVFFAERVARTAITCGGIGTILAVSTIFVFLAWIVMPLFSSASVGSGERLTSLEAAEPPWHMAVDEERVLAWTLHRDGALELTDLESGRRIDLRHPFGADVPTAASFTPGHDEVVFGFSDGSVRLGVLGFRTEFLIEADVPDVLRGLKIGATAVHDGGVVERTAVGQLRLTRLVLEVEEALETGSDGAVVALDHSVTPHGIYLIALLGGGRIDVSRVREQTDLMTGQVRRSLKNTRLERRSAGESRPPVFVGIGGLGQHAYAAWSDGRLEHWDLREFATPTLFGEVDLFEGVEPGTVTALAFVAGKQTLAVGDSAGRVRTWFPARVEDDDDPLLVQAHDLGRGDSPVSALRASSRSRLLVAGYGSGAIRGYQASLGDELFEIGFDEPALALVVPPKQDAILVRSRERITTWELDLAHPEGTLAALFAPVWYEGYGKPTHVWQSSSANDDFEPKFGLVPLVFGTLKATFYSMVFGAPLAILAAIFTSEFLSRKLRSSIKSVVELMASLPSVVLGFFAALVVAPYVQGVLPAVMLAFLTVPLATLTGAYLWQMLPARTVVAFSGTPRFLAIFATLPLGVGLAVLLAPAFEAIFFAGDLTAWLDGRVGAAWGGWALLLLPAAAVGVAMLFGLLVNPWLRRRSVEWTRERVARVEALKYVLGVLATVVLVLLVALALGAAGFDPRGGVVDTYVQRNALIVGFAMGFAIVPIIYTLAEDSLSEVPLQLREGSLGSGATHWQTAVRIVLPFAMSGIFSALMIGLGRAVGETMIVLMAVGNTPIMEWNIFNGFRTLSANIATELPEAVLGSAHYRALFLAGLVLFAMTFVLNTFAELVRRHFRKRMQQL